MSSKHPPVSGFFFRPSQQSDLFFIAGWTAVSTGQSEDWQHHFHKLLIKKFSAAAGKPQQGSWIAMSGRRPLFNIEIGSNSEIYVTGPPEILNDNRLALTAWRKVIAHLQKLGTPLPIRVCLDPSRKAERKALEKLGFITVSEDNEYGQTAFRLA